MACISEMSILRPVDPVPAGRPYQPACVPDPGEVAEVVGFVPLLAAFFQRARSDMPPAMKDTFDQHRLGPRHGAVLIQLFAGRLLSVTEIADRLGSSLPTA